MEPIADLGVEDDCFVFLDRLEVDQRDLFYPRGLAAALGRPPALTESSARRRWRGSPLRFPAISRHRRIGENLWVIDLATSTEQHLFQLVQPDCLSELLLLHSPVDDQRAVNLEQTQPVLRAAKA